MGGGVNMVTLVGVMVRLIFNFFIPINFSFSCGAPINCIPILHISNDNYNLINTEIT